VHLGLVDVCDGATKGAHHLRTMAVATEAAGFRSLWFPEHVVLFDEHHSEYPYAPAPGSDAPHRLEVGPDQGIFDPFLACAAAALHTTTLRVGTGVALVAARHPLVLAKELATLDHLSGGRFDLGVGVGWLREEFDALGIAFAERGRLTDECLEAVRALWTQRRPTYEGRHVRFGEVVSFPKPVQSPHPPILVGGESDAALRRAARLGDGWYGWNRTPEEARALIARLDELLAERGRSRRDVRVLLGLAHKGPLDALADYAAAVEAEGVDELTVAARIRPDGVEDRVAEIGAALGLRPPGDP